MKQKDFTLKEIKLIDNNKRYTFLGIQKSLRHGRDDAFYSWQMEIPCSFVSMEEKKHFSELRRMIPNISEKMLRLQRNQLEKDGMVKRKIYPEVPPKVEYYPSDFGKPLSQCWKKLRVGAADSRRRVVK